MSRIGKQPINLPEKVELSLDGSTVKVKGPLGELSYTAPEGIVLELNGRQLVVSISKQDRKLRALHGLVRTLINNMVVGVSQGFTKELELIGVGYRSQVQGKVLNLSLGYSHAIEVPIPDGIDIKVEANTKIAIKGACKQTIGDLAAFIRAQRPPEPYKGKGVRYKNEVIIKKAGKAGK